MIIYGAGMAGLMAGHYFRRFDPKIFEAQDSLPNNHAALLRFRSDIVSKTVNIPFKKVSVQKLVAHAGKLYDKPNLKLTNMYSQKVTGKVMERSIKSLEPVERFIAPDNYIDLLSKGLKVDYGIPLTKEFLANRVEDIKQYGEHVDPVISTIPMNIMMDLVDFPHRPEFNFRPIWSVTANIKSPATEAFNTVYYPDFTDDYYRISITGNKVIAEYNVKPGDNFQHDILMCLAREFGICEVEFEAPLEVKYQHYGKLLPIDNKIRKQFILYLTDKYRVYSLGRFATWRQILMDDVVQDLQIIESLIDQRDDYTRKLFSNGGKR